MVGTIVTIRLTISSGITVTFNPVEFITVSHFVDAVLSKSTDTVAIFCFLEISLDTCESNFFL